MSLVVAGGCVRHNGSEVVVYTALDKEFSEPILKQFEQETGIRVLAKYDVESNKTVGLANELLESTQRNRADVFWNNEIMHTLRLGRAGILAAYRSPRATAFPDAFVSPSEQWHGLAARARVIIVNTELVPAVADRPNSFQDLVDPRWKDKCGLAKPLFGTTATHAAVLFSQWGRQETLDFFLRVKQNAIIEGGNKQVALNVAAGRYAWGFTDTDDAIIEIEKGFPVAIIYPDQNPDQLGCMLIPNTLCILKDAPNPDAARQLVDFLLQPEIERRLAAGPSAQLPLATDVRETSRAVQGQLKIMPVDFDAAAENWETAKDELAELFR
jgi:iron(III) transport system substrate-binding protein